MTFKSMDKKNNNFVWVLVANMHYFKGMPCGHNSFFFKQMYDIMTYYFLRNV